MYAAYRTSQVVLVVKNPPVSAGDEKDTGSIPGLGRYPGGGHGNQRTIYLYIYTVLKYLSAN